MLRLKPRQWTFLADKVADVANLVAGALVVGFFLGEGRAPGRLLVAGLAIWGVLVIIALVVSAEEP